MQWRGIAETPSSYLVSRVTLVPLTVTPPDVIAKGPDTSLVCALSAYRLVRLFLHAARFPVVEASSRDAEQAVCYFDLCAAGQVQAIEFCNRVFPPTAPYY